MKTFPFFSSGNVAEPRKTTYTKADVRDMLDDVHCSLEKAAMLAIRNAGMDDELEVMLLQDVQAFMEKEYGEQLEALK